MISRSECVRLSLCISYYTNCIRYWTKFYIEVRTLLYSHGFGYVWLYQEIEDISKLTTPTFTIIKAIPVT